MSLPCTPQPQNCVGRTKVRLWNVKRQTSALITPSQLARDKMVSQKVSVSL